ncbi:MAG: glycosyltransferase [Deltaproteobacteria bacterium]|nr:glycosyltransferase [Deltaproteobacteria bacterium]
MSRLTRAQVAVVVPVYRDWASARVCVEALRAQTLSRERVRVILADNDPRGPAERIPAKQPWLSVVGEERPGSYAARNRALQDLADADVIAFTDADCTPAPDWLEQGLRALDTLPAPGRAGGRVEFVPQGPAFTFVEAFDAAIHMDQERYIAEFGFAATANLFADRAVLDRVGPFNASLKSSGDAEWGQRATALGIPQVYAPDAVVRHPARASFGSLVRKSRRLAGGFAARAQPQGGLLRTFLRDTRDELERISYQRRVLAARSRTPLSHLALSCVLAGVRVIERTRVRLGAPTQRS